MGQQGEKATIVKKKGNNSMFVADWIEKVPPQAYMFENLVLRRWCYFEKL